MMLAAISTATLLALAVIAMRAGDAAEQRSGLVTFDLTFPRDLSEEGVQAFLGVVGGLLPPWWRRWWHTPFIALEVHADRRGTQHRLLVPRSLVRTVETAMAAHLSSVNYSVVRVARPQLTVAAEYRLTTGDRSLDTAGTATTARLLSSLHPLASKEAVVVQVILAPARPVAPARLAKARGDTSEWLDDGVMLTSEAVSALKAKRSTPLLLASLRIGVAAANPGRGNRLLRDIEAAWRSTRAPGVMLRRRLLPSRTITARITDVRLPLIGWPALLNTDEAAAIVGMPAGITEAPGLSLQGCRPLPVPDAVPTRGTVLGDGTHPRTRRAVAISDTGRKVHALLTGPSGSGKSVLLAHLAIHDATQGRRPMLVIDPKDGELIDSILERLPERRLDDLIVLDPTDDRPVGFDPLASTPATRELVVERLVGLMIDIWGDNIGPRSADILRHVLLTIAAAEDLTLIEAPHLIVDESFRYRVLSSTDVGDEVRAWWQWVGGLGQSEWSAMTQGPLNKLRAFVGRTVVADTLGQPDPAVRFDRVLASGQILLVRLPAGLLGDQVTALLGAMVINQAWHAIAGRASLPRDERRTASVIIDEVGTVLRFPATSLDTMLAQARGYGVGVTLAAQHLAQLPTGLRAAAMTNARTKVVFATSRDDAGTYAREFGHGLSVEDLMGIEPFGAVTTVYAEGRSQAPATILTRPPDKALRPAEQIKATSRRRWGADREALAEARRQRRESPASSGGAPAGRRRRGGS